MTHQPTLKFFRQYPSTYPHFALTGVLILAAIILGMGLQAADWAIACFAGGLIALWFGVKVLRVPAARLTGRMLVLSDPRGIRLGARSYALTNIRRITLETRRYSVRHRLRGEVLLVNLAGVRPADIDTFIDTVRGFKVDVD